MKALTLRIEPSLRQTEAILARVEHEMVRRGARVTRQGVGALRFRMPPPWRRLPIGSLGFITAGRAKVAAGSGGPWQVLYELDFSVLRAVLIALTLILIVIGWQWPRAMLLNTLVGIWLLLYGAPNWIAGRRFHKILTDSTRDVVERRRTPRAVPAFNPEVTPVRPPERPSTPQDAPPRTDRGTDGG